MRSETAKHALMISGKTLLMLCVLALLAGSAVAQRGPARGKLEGIKDPELEVSSKHDLEVARWYLTKRKAYEGARDRLQEILDSYPDFSKIDEVIFLMGEVYHKLGKDADAAKYYNDILKNYPGSTFFKKAKEQLADLKPASDASGGPTDKTSPEPGKKQDGPDQNQKKPQDKPQYKPNDKNGPSSVH